MTCINLMKRCGDRYKIGFDPAYDPKNRPRDKLDPWMMVIPCRIGEIYPYGGDHLVLEVEGHRKIKAKLARLECCELYQDGDVFGSFLFHVDDFDEIAAIAKPHRRPQLSAERREALRQQMQQVRQNLKSSPVQSP